MKYIKFLEFQNLSRKLGEKLDLILQQTAVMKLELSQLAREFESLKRLGEEEEKVTPLKFKYK